MQPENNNPSASKWEYERNCPVCGEDFTATRDDHIYCDARCKQKAYYERNLKYKRQFDDRNNLEKLQKDYEALSRGLKTTQKKMYEHYDNWEAVSEMNDILKQELLDKDVRINELEKQLIESNSEIKN